MWTDEAANAFSQVNERNGDVSPTSSTLGCEANAKVAQVTSLVVEVYKPPLSLIESQFRCDFRKLSGNQKRASSVEVNRKQVQPVSLHTR
jgi:hypothetical protein